MKITKHGNKEEQKELHKFNCKNCGCVFECEDDEYLENPQINYNSLNSISWSAEKVYVTCCPECHKIIEDHVFDYSTYSSQSVTLKGSCCSI